MRAYARLVALLGGGFALSGLSVIVVGDHPAIAGVLFAVGTVLGFASESMIRARPRIDDALEGFQFGLSVRTGLRAVLLLGLAAVWAGPEPHRFWLVATTLVIVTLGRLLLQMARADAEGHRASPVSWRNLEVPGVVRHPPLAPRLLGDALRWVSAASVAVTAGVVIVLLGGPGGSVAVAAAFAMLVCGSLLALALVDLLRARRDTPHERTVDLLGAALAEYAPEVLFYYSRPEAIGYIANVWMPTLEQVQRRTVVLVREVHNAPLVRTDTLPVVTVIRPGDLERVVPDSVRLALYPSNVAKNNHLLRLPGIVDVFVGHGDSDKGGSATVLTRIFDEAWVSGPAARERYRVANVGVRDDQIREIGRPQLAEIRKVSGPADALDEAQDTGEWDYTVLYAPTREGFFAEWQYSSVITQGATILQTLIGMPGVRVLFKPHPGTGTDEPDFLDEVNRLKDLVMAAGAPHELVTGAEGLYQAFNRADLLVSDISSVITDFLASGKPYVVTNSGGAPADDFRREFPSAGGAYILDGDGEGVAAFVQDARTVDSLREQRRTTAAYLLGDSTQDPLERFTEAIDAVGALARRA